MKSTLFNTGRFALLLTLIGSLLAGCGTATPVPPTAAPTTDPATYVAAAVETLRAQMTEQAKLNPTATNTPVPTATLVPTETPIPASPTPAMSPTPAPTKAPALSAQALYAGGFPENLKERKPNEKFGLALGFKNTGSVPWPSGMVVKIVGFKGEITVQQEAQVEKGANPGEKIEFDLWAYGSETLGQHIWYFQLYTPEGVAVPGGSIAYSYTSV